MVLITARNPHSFVVSHREHINENKQNRNDVRKRINPPIEGVHAQTGCKGQRATLERAEIKGNKTFQIPEDQ